jgi:hypothetical protein
MALPVVDAATAAMWTWPLMQLLRIFSDGKKKGVMIFLPTCPIMT